MKKILPFLILVLILGVFYFFLSREKEQEMSLVFYWDGQNYQLREINEFKKGLDYDKAGIGIILKNQRLYVYHDEKEKWRSSFDWRVENVIVADLDNDGNQEVGFSLWKLDQRKWRNHLFIYKWKENDFRPAWCSSVLDAPIYEMSSLDINKDGKNELIVLEGNYRKSKYLLAEYVTVWSWNGWGFTNEFRSRKGRFYNLFTDISGVYLKEKVPEIVPAFAKATAGRPACQRLERRRVAGRQ